MYITYIYYTYSICYMAYRTLDPTHYRISIPILVLHHTKLRTLFTISTHHCHLACWLFTVTNQNYTRYSSYTFGSTFQHATIPCLPFYDSFDSSPHCGHVKKRKGIRSYVASHKSWLLNRNFHIPEQLRTNFDYNKLRYLIPKNSDVVHHSIHNLLSW